MSGPLDSAKVPTAVVVGGTYNVVSPAPVDGQSLSLQQDADGNLLVNVAVGGGSSGTVKIEDTSGNALNSNGSGALQVAVVSGGGSNPSVSATGSAVPADATMVGGTDGTDLRALSVSNTGVLNVAVVSGGGSNASVGTTGVTAPTSATEIGIIDGSGNLTGVSPTTPLPISATAAANASGNPIFVEAVSGSTTAVTNAGTFEVQITGHSGVTLDAVLGATKPANVLQVGGNDGTNAYAIPLAASGTSVLVSGTVSIGSGPFVVTGNLTNNNAAPSTNNIGALSALANAAAPTWNEGDLVLSSVDLAGNQRVLLHAETTKVIGTVRATGNIGGVFDAVLGAAIPANAIQVGGSDGTDLRALLTRATGQLHVLADSGSTTAVTGVVEVAPTGAANTLSNPFFNVLADNSGHALTVNSTATASKYALDTNILSILGTAPTTAGFLDIKGADGNVFVRQTTASNLNATVVGAAATGAAVAGNPLLVAGKDGNGNVLPITSGAGGTLSVGSANFTAADALSNTLFALFDASNNSFSIKGLASAPFLFNGSTWDRARSAGVGNAVASTGLAAAVGYVQYNTTLPAPTAAQYTAAQCDTVGSTYVNIEGRKATYSAFASFTAVAGDIAVLPGSASKTIRVIRVEVSFTTSGTAAVEAVQLIKRSAADTSGTSAAMTSVPHDSNFSAASALPLNYTVAPTPGAAVGTIRGVQFNDASSLVPGANSWIWDFGARPSAAIVLRGVAQMLCINLPTAVATQTATVSFEWTEE